MDSRKEGPELYASPDDDADLQTDDEEIEWEEEEEDEDDLVDEASEESFPASDPPAFTS